MFAADINSLQDSALNNYLEQNYDNAFVFYDSIQKLGYSSPELYFNLGNCYYNTGDIAGAVLFYEKALVLKPGDTEIKYNLNIAKAAVKTKTEDLPEVFYKVWFDNMVNLMCSDSWLITSIILFIAALASIGLYFFSRKLVFRKIGFIAGIALVALSISFGIFAKIQANKITGGNYAVVFDSAVIKSSPSQEGTNLFEISEGMKVEITDSLNNWAEIKLADGKKGWIESVSIRRI